jgi:hypothetical protein
VALVKVEPCDISAEAYREYDFIFGDEARLYRIDNPVSLYIGTSTHRVVDGEGVVHCIPAPGHFGCVLRWKPKPGNGPVQF